MIEINCDAWKNIPKKMLKMKVLRYFQTHHAGKVVVNEHLGLTIKLEGGRKLSHGGNVYPLKACLVEVLPQLIISARYSNYGRKKPGDKKGVVGYFNFNASVLMDGEEKHVHLVIRQMIDGRFYYTHELNVYKK